MLYLLKQESGSNFFYLISDKEYVVGRKNADIILSNDQSISRQHAIIKVQDDSVKLIDCGSKYGTCHRGSKIQANTEIPVEDQDIIKFGVFQSIYKISKFDIVTTSSGLNNPQKNALKKSLELLGGTFVNNWESTCTYLTVQEIVLTIKVLHALLDDKPMVTLEFWNKFVENIKKNEPPPKVEDFKPKVAEVLLDTSALNPNPKRKVIFKGKTFVFPTDKIKSKMEDLIMKTGGESLSWEQQPLTLPQITNPKNNYLFIHSDEVKQIPDSLNQVYENLKKLGQRTIPVQEIALAVMWCSCEKNCNPYFDRIQKVFFKEENDSCSEMFPLACETQSQDAVVESKREIIIPGSLEADSDLWRPPNNNMEPQSTVNYGASTSNANLSTTVNYDASTSSANIITTPSTKRINEESAENPFKKPKLSGASTAKEPQTAIESKKRKADENLESPSKKSSLKENPFAILRKRSNKQIGSDNPFTGLRIKQEKVLENNPFVKTLEQHNDVSQKEEISAETESVALFTNTRLTYDDKSRCTNLSDIKWLSKNSGNVKTEICDIDEEFKEIYNKFRDTVIIEVIPLTTARRINLYDSVEGSVKNENVKNFKKFKKVRPTRPQVNIIHATISQIANTANQNQVTVLSDVEDDDRPPTLSRRKVTNPNTSRRFKF